MHCSKCGVQNADGVTPCVSCGSVLTGTPQPVEVQEIPVTKPKTSRLAIASLVIGLLSVFCVTWPICGPLAIVFGIIALVKIRNNKAQLKGAGLAVTGILVPLLVLIAVILMPPLGCPKIAPQIVCATHLKGLSIAMMVYANDYDDMLPTENWCDLFIEEVDVSPKSFICPDSDTIEGESSYAMNKNIVGMKLGDLPADIVLFFETDKGIESSLRNTSIQARRHYEFLNEYGNVYNENTLVYKDRFNQFGGPEGVLIRHKEGCNFAFADGHVEFVREDCIADLQWTVE